MTNPDGQPAEANVKLGMIATGLVRVSNFESRPGNQTIKGLQRCKPLSIYGRTDHVRVRLARIRFDAIV